MASQKSRHDMIRRELRTHLHNSIVEAEAKTDILNMLMVWAALGRAVAICFTRTAITHANNHSYSNTCMIDTTSRKGRSAC